ncbi:hypothetical protein ACFXPT_37830 [Streptomyces goshikiensis]|uniref:hypothetical protein n=1 Tax=Streptomyces goshikiensis TaxID=1942 RepID=UPI0036A1795A
MSPELMYAVAAATPALVALAIVCAAALVCIVAICRAHRSETVMVVRALPELAATLLRYRRRPRP